MAVADQKIQMEKRGSNKSRQKNLYTRNKIRKNGEGQMAVHFSPRPPLLASFILGGVLPFSIACHTIKMEVTIRNRQAESEGLLIPHASGMSCPGFFATRVS